MEIRWLGTAGFDIRACNSRFLIDPFVRRNPQAEPVQPLTPADLAGADRIFVSHGHFDHLMDLPEILAQDPEKPALVFCSSRAARTLEKNGVSRSRICRVTRDRTPVRFGPVTARACFSRHIRFDFPRIAAALARINTKMFRILPLFTRYPCGQVLSWRFFVEGKTIQHLGSSGSLSEALTDMAPPDILMLPLQGHSHICGIAAAHVRQLRPGTVIVHHHDNFYPPVSRTVDIGPFIEKVKQKCPHTRIIVPRMNIPITICT